MSSVPLRLKEGEVGADDMVDDDGNVVALTPPLPLVNKVRESEESRGV